jgi:histidinol-phosphate aminotransferase
MTILERALERTKPLPRYSPGKAASGTDAGKLSSNEAAFGPSPKARAAVRGSADMIHLYPTRRELTEAVAHREGRDVAEIVLTNGSDELCYLIAALLIDPGDRVVTGNPCYAIDALASLLHKGVLVGIPLSDGAHDLTAMADAAQDARLVWLPNPHNPTGTAVQPGDFVEFLDRIPPTCLIVLDEAYRDFMDAGLEPDVDVLQARHENLIVQRTFSKGYALAGLRVGYALAHTELALALNTIRPPFNLSVAAHAAAVAAIKDEAWRRFGVTMIARERQKLVACLQELDLRHYPSQANFVTVELGDQVAPTIAALGVQGIAVRDGVTLGIPGWVRISIGAPAQMALLRRVFSEITLAR